MTGVKLGDANLILDDAKLVNNTITSSGGKLKAKKQRIANSSGNSGPCFLANLDTLLYG